MTGATGGIGCKVAKKLMKAGKLNSTIKYFTALFDLALTKIEILIVVSFIQSTSHHQTFYLYIFI